MFFCIYNVLRIIPEKQNQMEVPERKGRCFCLDPSFHEGRFTDPLPCHHTPRVARSHAGSGRVELGKTCAVACAGTTVPESLPATLRHPAPPQAAGFKQHHSH